MNKNNYLKKLREILKENFVDENEVKQIINDYDDLYTQGLEQGLTDQEVILKLGEPNSVFNSLKHDLTFVKTYQNKLVGIMVFVSTILFFIIGRAFKLWDYSWLSFLLIPITAILTNVREKNKLTALSVFISIFLFYTLGLSLKIWHPLWLIFLSIPMIAIIINVEKEKMAIALMPFLSLLIFILVGYYHNDFYSYGWLVFFSTPILACFMKPFTKSKIWMGIILILSILAYITLVVKYNNYYLPLLVFVIPFIYAILTKKIIVIFEMNYLLKHPVLFTLVVMIIIGYFIISYILKGWNWTWTILLIIPMLLIYSKDKFKNIVSYAPFVSLILFFLTGYLIEGGFEWSWLFFLLVPITGILNGETSLKVEKKDNDE
jgi:uncharacterized membrane protein